MNVDWSQDPQHLEMASKAIGAEFNAQPTYWLSVMEGATVKAVVVYCSFTACSCQISIATFAKRPFDRPTIRTLFAYPFHQLNLRRLHAYTRTDSRVASDQLSRLGFRVEGLLRNWYPDCHGVLHGLLKEECKWL